MENMAFSFEGFPDHMEEKKNRKLATLEWLQKEKIPYTSHNNGIHLKITMNGKTIDFWPTTGCIKVNNSYLLKDLNYLKNFKTTKEQE